MLRCVRDIESVPIYNCTYICNIRDIQLKLSLTGAFFNQKMLKKFIYESSSLINK